ncbi:MAG: low molecular weight protein arginine phosphatase [Anaerolineae bacterium]|jgi:protein-tyrosine phosphatase
MTTILLVCTGNLCRSPMAAGLLRARLNQDKERRDWRVVSAGTWASEGRPASAYSIAEMLERGIDIQAHRARSIDEALIRQADLILVMTRTHAEALSIAFPDQTERMYLLSDMVRETYDISDPYGGTRLEYAYTAQELERLIDAGYDRIVSLAERDSGA